MSANWPGTSGELSGRAGRALETALHGMAQPKRAGQLRHLLVLLLALWAIVALSHLVWALLPAEQTDLPGDINIINPVTAPKDDAKARSVNISRVMNWHLFGKAGAPVPVTPVAAEPEATPGADAREGIEKGARETRLDLKLRGVVASSEDGLGHAIIEFRKKQAIYAVDDKLPASGNVKLAKVMPSQVVLDNGGKYELLTLFEPSSLDGKVATPAPRPAASKSTSKQVKPQQAVDKRADAGATSLARSYRDQLYQNPQSLAAVVNVAAVRDGGQLRGYRVSPGKDKEQFVQLGFQAGDLVTGVNGISLDDPANTMKLYQAMRSAEEVVFDLERDDEPLTISVSLGDMPQRQ